MGSSSWLAFFFSYSPFYSEGSVKYLVVIGLVSPLGLLKAVHSSVEAEVGLAVVLVGQAVQETCNIL